MSTEQLEQKFRAEIARKIEANVDATMHLFLAGTINTALKMKHIPKPKGMDPIDYLIDLGATMGVQALVEQGFELEAEEVPAPTHPKE